MGIAKVVYDNETLIDLTSDTVAADNLMEGFTAHDAAGNAVTGTASGGDARESIKRILLVGFADGSKVFSDDGTVITSTADDGRTLVKTFSDSFSVVTSVLTSAEGSEIARAVKTFAADGKSISTVVTYA